MHALPFIAAGAKIFSGVAGMAAAEDNRRVAYEAADEELRASAAQERRVRADARRATGAMAASQKALIASLPRCPPPRGSKNDGPTGSSSTASSAKSASHSCFALRTTAS